MPGFDHWVAIETFVSFAVTFLAGGVGLMAGRAALRGAWLWGALATILVFSLGNAYLSARGREDDARTTAMLNRIGEELGIDDFSSPEDLARKVQRHEADRRERTLDQLRDLYLLSHDNISPELAAGLTWPPEQWLNSELQRMNEPWRVTIDGRDVQTNSVTPATQ